MGMNLVCSGKRVIVILLGTKGGSMRLWLCRQGEVPHVLGCVIFPCRFLVSALYPVNVSSQSFFTSISSGSQSCRLGSPATPLHCLLHQLHGFIGKTSWKSMHFGIRILVFEPLICHVTNFEP